VFEFEFILVIYPPTILGGQNQGVSGEAIIMPLNNSHGFPSILLVNFSILYTVGKTKLSKNGKKNMRFFDILSRSTKKQEAVSLAFLHRIFEQKYMRASVKTACREKTCLAFALSRAQRVCNCAPQNVSLHNLYRNYGHEPEEVRIVSHVTLHRPFTA